MERRLAAVLSADAAGFTALMARDEAAALAALDSSRSIMGGLVRQHGGRVVDAVGDNLLAEFPSAVDAVLCAVAVQAQIADANEELAPDNRLVFRIGVNVGDLVVLGERIAGDGVNVAARLEALATPGGVTVSRAVMEHIEGKVQLPFVDRGEHAMKNVPRPVHVFEIATEATGTGPASEGATHSPSPHVPGFGGSSTIAVLPFRNLGNDPEQEYFADGITEDLIASLAALRIYPIISRNSSFAFKGRQRDAAGAGRELGAHYIVTGSVRRADRQVRVTAELEDTHDGHQLWSGRYDRELNDYFAVQDEITAAIAGALGPALIQSEMLHAIRRSPENPDAWDCVHRGLWYLYRYTREEVTQARAWAERALELQPDLPMAYCIIAFSHMYEVVYGWTTDRLVSIRLSARAAERAVAADRKNPMALTALGFSCALTGDHERGLAVLEQAVDANPSSALALWSLGSTLNVAGRPDEGIPLVEKAMRLSPQDPLTNEFLFSLASAHFQAGRYQEALEHAERSLSLKPDQPGAWRVVTAANALLDRPEAARQALGHLSRVAPDMLSDHLRGHLHPDLAERYTEALRKAGWKG